MPVFGIETPRANLSEESVGYLAKGERLRFVEIELMRRCAVAFPRARSPTIMSV
jgi:hypothetical protein